MPKPPKTKPKDYSKTQPKRIKQKMQPKPVSITTSKFYWISLTTIIVIAVLGYGVLTGVAIQKIALIMLTLLSVIALAWYIRVKPSTMTTKLRATYLFVGAAVVGFSIWAVTVVVLGATGLGVQVSNSLGDQLFIITSQVIFFVIGAFIGDWIGINRNSISAFFSKLRRK
jgi:FtsH-binding integral membrane protein